MNWIQTSGNFVKGENGGFKYTPTKDLKEFSHGEVPGDKKYLLFTSVIQFSTFFENGVIEFKVNVKEQDAFFSLSFSESKIVFSLNSSHSEKAFAFRNKDSIIAIQAVDKGSILLNHDYLIRIQVDGSIVRLFVDDVFIGYANFNIIRSQVRCNFRSRKEILLKNFKIDIKKPRVFVVMQFSDEYNQLYTQVVKPVCEFFGYECLRGDEYFTTGSILKDIIDAINESAIVIADITPNNANVFYEVGYSHALNKPTILLSDKKRDKLPFDVSGFRTLFYDNTIAGKTEVEEKLKKHLENIQMGN